MKLNAAEQAVMNNPVRAAVQRRYEATCSAVWAAASTEDERSRSAADEAWASRSSGNTSARHRWMDSTWTPT